MSTLKVKHENIIELVDVFGHVSSVSIVMDFMDTDLEVRICFIKMAIDVFVRWLSRTRAWFLPQQISNHTHFKRSLVWNTCTSTGFSTGAEIIFQRFGQGVLKAWFKGSETKQFAGGQQGLPQAWWLWSCQVSIMLYYAIVEQLVKGTLGLLTEQWLMW